MDAYEKALDEVSKWRLMQVFDGMPYRVVMKAPLHEITGSISKQFNEFWTPEQKAQHLALAGLVIMRPYDNDNIKGKRLPSLKTLPWWKNG